MNLNDVLVLDLETAGKTEMGGLEPYRDDSYTTIAAWAEPSTRKSGTILWPDAEIIEEKLLEHDTIAGWNVAFDVAWLFAMGVDETLIYNINWLDVMTLWRRVDRHKGQLWSGTQSYSLKQYVAENFPSYAGYGEDIDYHVDLDGVIPDDLIKYAELDAQLTSAAFDQLRAKATPLDLQGWLLECRAIPMVAQANLRGIRINYPRNLYLKDIHHYSKIEQLRRIGVAKEVVKSPKQLGELLLEKGVPLTELTDSGQLSVSKDILKPLAAKYPIVDAVVKYREAATNDAKFVTGIHESLRYNNTYYTYPVGWIARTYTGRMTYSSKSSKPKYPSGFALHQMSRLNTLRSQILPPENHALVEWDWSGQEMRLMADYSGDENMLEKFIEGYDLHSWMACVIYNLDYTEFLVRIEDEEVEADTMRKLGKLANLSLQYRTGWRKLQLKAFTDYGLIVSEIEAKELIRAYHSAWPRIKEYQQMAIDRARTCGFSETRGGRRVALEDWTRDRDWRLESTAINFPIQGTGGDLKALGLATLREEFPEAIFGWDLHDAIFGYIHDTADGDTAGIAEQVQVRLSNLDYHKLNGWEPKLPLPVDCKIGYDWGNMTSLEKWRDI